MALFDKYKKTASTVGNTAIGIGLGAAAASALTNSSSPDQSEPSTTDSFSDPESDNSHSQLSETVSSILNPETGATTSEYPNGNILTEYTDGSRSFFNAVTGETTAYDASTGETVIYEADTSASFDSTDSALGQSPNGLFSRFKAINDDIPDAMKAAGLGIPDRPVSEFRTYKEGNLEDGKVRSGYEAKEGWESTYHQSHSGQDEIFPGATLNSTANYDAESFIGASSKGEVGAEWNREEAHLYAEGRSMIGAEANVNGTYKGTLDIEGINHQPGVDLNGNAHAFAGAEVQGQGNLDVTSEGASGNLGAGAFAGAKAEINASGGLSVDGNEFARGEGGLDARAGAGAEFNIGAGYQDGQIEYGIDMGVALGVGAGYRYQGSVDAPGILTHPDAVWDSAVEEVNNYVPEMPDFSTDPNTYINQLEQYGLQQAQEILPSMPEEISQVAEAISDPGSVLEDFGNSLF
jgi:hypothetical protein